MKQIEFGSAEIIKITLQSGESYTAGDGQELGTCGAFFVAVAGDSVTLFPQSGIAKIEMRKAQEILTPESEVKATAFVMRR